MTVTINKWGHSLGLRLPKLLAEKNEFKEGTEVEFIETAEGLIIRKKQNKVSLDLIIKSYPRQYKPEEELIPENLPSEGW